MKPSCCTDDADTRDISIARLRGSGSVMGVAVQLADRYCGHAGLGWVIEVLEGLIGCEEQGAPRRTTEEWGI